MTSYSSAGVPRPGTGRPSAHAIQAIQYPTATTGRSHQTGEPNEGWGTNPAETANITAGIATATTAAATTRSGGESVTVVHWSGVYKRLSSRVGEERIALVGRVTGRR